MTDFVESLQRGLNAAKQAQENRDEIRGVLDELNQALHRMSGGQVEIAIVQSSDLVDSIERLVASLGNKPPADDEVLAIRPIGRKDAKPRRIARWKQGASGYPCTIIWDGHHASCEDAESLRSELAELVSSPSVGEAILASMSFSSTNVIE